MTFRAPSIGFVSTYPPTVCGLATYTASLRHAMGEVRGTTRQLGVAGLRDASERGEAADGVHGHRRGDPASLRATTAWLNRFDTVSIQHEFGIHAGPDGAEVIDLVAGLDVPVATTFHTVLDTPSAHQRAIVESLAATSGRSIVMSRTAAQRLVHRYDVDPDRVVVIPHGVSPALTDPTPVTDDGSSRPLVLTWGLIGPGKGLEAAIRACTALLDLHPRPRYVIAGATHPAVRRRDGEAYRQGLKALVRRLGLGSVVEFDDRYLDARALVRLVRRADLVVLPYESTEQVTSGVLVEAIAAGRPVVATDFPHARELLPAGAGTVVPHDDPRALGRAVRAVLTDPPVAARMRREARQLALDWGWPTIARRHEQVMAGLSSSGGWPSLRVPTPEGQGAR